MATKAKSIFSSANTQTVSITTRITKQLKDDLDLIDGKLEALDVGLRFERQAIIETALRGAADKALEELEEMEAEANTTISNAQDASVSTVKTSSNTTATDNGKVTI